jgi:Xaa-Pro aminopeptidase
LNSVHTPPREEVDRKIERLSRAAHGAGLRGVLLTTHWNFSWLTAGGSNRIDVSREAGAGALLVAAAGDGSARRYLLGNAIEMPRLSEEVVPGLGFDPVEFPWTADRVDPSFLVNRASGILEGGPLGADAALRGTEPFEAQLSGLRRQLEPEELRRYHTLGAEVGRAVGELLQLVPTGTSEREVVREVAIAVTGTKVEETCLVTSGGVEVITASPGWPATPITAQRRTLLLSDQLVTTASPGH